MLTKIKFLSALAGAMCLANTAWGYTIDSGLTNVGGLDTFISQTNSLGSGGSGQTAETNWVNSFLNPDTTWTTKTETVSYARVDGQTNIYAFALQSDPGYYIIKNAQNWALYKNEASSDWAVFDLAALTLSKWNLGGTGELTISHVSEFGGTTSVPEPASLALFGLGLAGLAFSRRRKQV